MWLDFLSIGVTAQEVKIASMRGFAAEDNPDLRQAQLGLQALRAQLARAEGASPVNPDSSNYTEKYRSFKYSETLFELITRQYEIAPLDEAREGALLQVIDVATVPEKKSKPQHALIFVGAVLLAAFLLATS